MLMHLYRAIALAIACFMPYAYSTETGVSETTIRIGMSSPFSGPNGAYGMEMKEAISAYFQQVNASGGIHGRKLELVALDDGYETDRTVANTKKLIEEHKVFALMQYYGSSPTTEAMKVFSAAKVPLVGTVSGADSIRTPVNRYMFHVRASYADETDAIVNQLVTLGIKQIGVFYQNDGFGKSGLDGVVNALKKHNLKPVAVGTVERNSVDVTAAADAIAKEHPQAVVMVTLYKPTAAFVKRMRALGEMPQYMTLSPVGADLLVKELGELSRGIGISQVVPYPWNDTVLVVKEYQRLISQAVMHHNYSYYGVEGYITARVMTDALRKAGKDLTREKLTSILEGMSQLDVGGFQVGYTPQSHNGSRFVDLTVIGPGGRVLR